MYRTTFSEAVDGYLLYAEARPLSKHTILDYCNTFAKFALFIGIEQPPPLNQAAVRKWIAANSQVRRTETVTSLHDLWQLALAHDLIADPDLTDIDHRRVERFLAGCSGLKKKTLLNYHVGLSALWTWADKEKLVEEHILHRVDPPEPETMVIKPYTLDEVKRLLDACKVNQEYYRQGQLVAANRRYSETRDKATILLLLDTGIRASEFVNLDVADVNLKERRLIIRFGKGSKERYVYFSPRTGRVLWRYLNSRDDAKDMGAPLVRTVNYTRMSRSGLLQFVVRAGRRTGVQEANVHRFRHTFAIQSLRNGMNAFVLQQLLGHSSMDMVRRYLEIARADLGDGHRQASPVDNWRL